MSESPSRASDAAERAATSIARALIELSETASTASLAEARRELGESRAALEALAERFERQFTADAEQRMALASQLTNLAGSLDRLVGHLQGLAELMAGVVQSGQERGAPPASAPEPAFAPGGEGVSLSIMAVPNFQVLMDIQKALTALDQVAGASVERFQEGDSRVLVHLEGAITPSALVSALQARTGHAFAVEESRPELMSLRLKIVP